MDEKTLKVILKLPKKVKGESEEYSSEDHSLDSEACSLGQDAARIAEGAPSSGPLKKRKLAAFSTDKVPSKSSSQAISQDSADLHLRGDSSKAATKRPRKSKASEDAHVVSPKPPKAPKSSREMNAKVKRKVDKYGSSVNSEETEHMVPPRKIMEGVITKLKKKDIYSVFSMPVNSADVPDYYTIIKNPMDFGTMLDRVRRKMYRTWASFQEDILLICSNAMTYNKPDTVYHKQAKQIQEASRRAIEAAKKQAVAAAYGVEDDVAGGPSSTSKGDLKRKRSTNSLADTSGYDEGDSEMAWEEERETEDTRDTMDDRRFVRPALSDRFSEDSGSDRHTGAAKVRVVSGMPSQEEQAGPSTLKPGLKSKGSAPSSRLGVMRKGAGTINHQGGDLADEAKVGSSVSAVRNSATFLDLEHPKEASLERPPGPEVLGTRPLPLRDGRRPLAPRDNRRLTYQPRETGKIPRTGLEGEQNRVIATGWLPEHGYARSMALFGGQLGSRGWQLAAARIRKVLAPNVRFGQGWVGTAPCVKDPTKAVDKSSGREELTIKKERLQGATVPHPIAAGEAKHLQAGDGTVRSPIHPPITSPPPPVTAADNKSAIPSPPAPPVHAVPFGDSIFLPDSRGPKKQEHTFSVTQQQQQFPQQSSMQNSGLASNPVRQVHTVEESQSGTLQGHGDRHSNPGPVHSAASQGLGAFVGLNAWSQGSVGGWGSPLPFAGLSYPYMFSQNMNDRALGKSELERGHADALKALMSTGSLQRSGATSNNSGQSAQMSSREVSYTQQQQQQKQQRQQEQQQQQLRQQHQQQEQKHKQQRQQLEQQQQQIRQQQQRQQLDLQQKKQRQQQQDQQQKQQQEQQQKQQRQQQQEQQQKQQRQQQQEQQQKQQRQQQQEQQQKQQRQQEQQQHQRQVQQRQQQQMQEQQRLQMQAQQLMQEHQKKATQQQHQQQKPQDQQAKLGSVQQGVSSSTFNSTVHSALPSAGYRAYSAGHQPAGAKVTTPRPPSTVYGPTQHQPSSPGPQPRGLKGPDLNLQLSDYQTMSQGQRDHEGQTHRQQGFFPDLNDLAGGEDDELRL